ncbi:hypothetical protein D3C80_2095870 [compost metagenome]
MILSQRGFLPGTAGQVIGDVAQGDKGQPAVKRDALLRIERQPDAGQQAQGETNDRR